MNVQGSLAFEFINPAEVAKAANLFDTLKQLRLRLKNGDEAVLERAFEIHVQGVLEKLDARIPQISDPYQQRVEVIMARHGLYDASYQQVLLLCQSISPALGDCVRDLRAVQSAFIGDFQQILVNMREDQAQLSTSLLEKSQEIEQHEENIRKLQDTMLQLNQENEQLNQQILDLRQHLRNTIQEMHKYKEISSSDPKLISYPPFQHDAVPTGNSLSMRRSLSTASLSISSTQPPPNSPSYMRPRTPKSERASNAREETYLAAGFQSGEESSVLQRQGLNTPSKKPLSLASPVNWLRSFREDIQKAMDMGRCRDISLKECKDTIARLYESKAIANDKAMQGIGNLPMETMEQHTFRMLEKRYGLRDLAVVHAGMLLLALKKYCGEDNEVAVFVEIFRNEIEEDFHLIQQELIKSVRDLTQVQLMGRFPQKDQGAIASMLEEKLTGGYIQEEEWRDLVGYLYNELDAHKLCTILQNRAILDKGVESPSVVISSPGALSASLQPKQLSAGTTSPFFNLSSPSPSNRKAGGGAQTVVMGSPSVIHHSSDLFKAGKIGYDRRQPRDVKRLGYSSRTLNVMVQDPNKMKKQDKLRLFYPTFFKILLDFQLSSHQDYLSNFVKIFRHIDQNTDGVLSAKEFYHFFVLLRKVTENAEILTALLERPVDSNNTSKDVSFFREAKDGSVGDEMGLDGSEEESKTFFTLLKTLDPLETDRITFSSAVSVLSQIQNGSAEQTVW
eukprot:gene1390-1511_t